MRKIFSSQRVENAEGVAQILRDAGIEVRVTNGRSYQSKRRGQFSYLDTTTATNLPAVWVVHADDQPRARDILREARLLDTTRRDHPTAEYAFAEAPASTGNGRGWAWRLRFILMAVIAGLIVLMVLRQRSAPEPEPTVPLPATHAQPAAPVQEDAEEVRVRIQPSTPAPPKSPAPAN